MAVIKIPGKIEPALKAQILKDFREATKSTSSTEIDHIRMKIPKVIKRLKSHSGAWPDPVANVARVLFSELLHMKMRRSTVLPRDAILSIISALDYLCKVDDVIPDYTPGIGYYDDALVLNECLKIIRKTDKSHYRRILNLIQESKSENG